MLLSRRTFVHLGATAAALPAMPRFARAQTFPTHPITMVVPFPAGGPADLIARILADRMRAPLHWRTEEIGACLADPLANSEGRKI